jgi:hypothetical protein
MNDPNIDTYNPGIQNITGNELQFSTHALSPYIKTTKYMKNQNSYTKHQRKTNTPTKYK